MSSDPFLPDSVLRSRQDGQNPSKKTAMIGTFLPPSPTSTLLSSSPGGAGTASPSLFRGFSQNRVNTPPAAQRMAPRRTVTIKTDPVAITSFDPSDKELYDLWVPANP